MMFGDHIIRTGLFTKKDANDLHTLFLLRQTQTSDYEADEIVPEIAAIDAGEMAEFLLQVEAYLRSSITDS